MLALILIILSGFKLWLRFETEDFCRTICHKMGYNKSSLSDDCKRMGWTVVSGCNIRVAVVNYQSPVADRNLTRCGKSMTGVCVCLTDECRYPLLHILNNKNYWCGRLLNYKYTVDFGSKKMLGCFHETNRAWTYDVLPITVI